jgi:hypothetical protein
MQRGMRGQGGLRVVGRGAEVLHQVLYCTVLYCTVLHHTYSKVKQVSVV